LKSYIQCFLKDAREIFEYFNFAEFIGQLSDANLLYKVVERVRQTDLSPKVISNHDMGLTFEELIRRFAESSNDIKYTPKSIVNLITELIACFARNQTLIPDSTEITYRIHRNMQ
jgi:type I restriction enzyme M protein